MRRYLRAVLMCLVFVQSAMAAQSIPQSVVQDPRVDLAHPARTEIIHVPVGGVELYGVVHVAAGVGPHPTLVFFHGLPGVEKNLDLAQAVRRAGWNAVWVNYRGAWGSPGTFSFAHTLEDAQATLAYLRQPAVAAKLGSDPARIAIGGHSMGAWVAALTLAQDHDHKLLGGVMISAGDMGLIGEEARAHFDEFVTGLDENRETLSGATGKSMTEELVAHAEAWTFEKAAPGLLKTPLYVLSGSRDEFAPHSAVMVNAIQGLGGKSVSSLQVPTDHSWSDKRITLSGLVVNWLGTLNRGQRKR